MIRNIIRKIIISENENLFINEITSKEAKEKFYADVDNDLFKTIVNLDPTYNQEKDIMGQYTKWLLSKKNLPIIKQMKSEDYYKVAEDLRKFEKLKKTKKVKGEGADINKYNINTLADFMFSFGEEDVVSNTEKEKEIKRKVEKYSVGKWDIIVPETEEASCYYGKGTRWCTAADYNNMFKSYKDDGDLWIIINKKDPSDKYQFHFESGQYMNRLNREIDLDVFFAYNEELRDFFLSRGYYVTETILYFPIVAEKMLDLGKLNFSKVNDDDIYYILMDSPIADKILNSGKLDLSGLEADDIKDILTTSSISNKIKQVPYFMKVAKEKGIELNEYKSIIKKIVKESILR